jgi:integrase
MGTIRFELNNDKSKVDKAGKSPIRVFYQIGGDRKSYSTGQKIFKENWSQKDQQAVFYFVDNTGKKTKGKLLDSEVKKINNKLSDLKRDIQKIEVRFEANETIYSPQLVLDELSKKDAPLAKKDRTNKEVYSFIDKYITNNSLSRVHGSLSVYKSLRSHLEGYEKKTGKTISFEKINKEFFQSFKNYLIGTTKKNKKGETVRLLNNVTIAKILSTLKTFLNYAREHDIKVPEVKFKIERENDLEVIALTQSEFDALLNMKLTNRPAWDAVRDVFIFSCCTGYRFSDLQQLSWNHIHLKEGYIQLRAVKTGHLSKVPLNSISTAILKKYEGQPRPLPVISNQKSNEHLSKICDWAGINTPVEIVRKYGSEKVVNVYPKYELVRMHCGRKTFATLSLEKGMSVEVVMQIGGWRSYASFKRYLNVTDDRAITAMQKSWGTKTIGPKLKAV